MEILKLFLILETLLINGLIIGVFGVLITLIALYGVIKEHKLIMIGMTVLGIIQVIIYGVFFTIYLAIWILIVTILSGVYARKIAQKEMFNFDNEI